MARPRYPETLAMRARTFLIATLLVACNGGQGSFNGFDFYQTNPGGYDPGASGDNAKPTNDPESTTNDPGSCYVQAGTYVVTYAKVAGGDQCANVDLKKNETFVIKQSGSLQDLVKGAQSEPLCTVVVSGCTASVHCTFVDTTTTTTSGPDGGTTTTTKTSNGPVIDETITVRGGALDGTVTIDGCTFSFDAVFQSSDTSDQKQPTPGGGADGGTITFDAGP